ncbi:MAG: hypothetical protein ABSG11_03600 [Candidatus Korobacteraceae bacterium]|jgi:hypothetical protein
MTLLKVHAQGLAHEFGTGAGFELFPSQNGTGYWLVRAQTRINIHLFHVEQF